MTELGSSLHQGAGLVRQTRAPWVRSERLLAPFLRRIPLDTDSISRLAEAHERGIVVHTLRVRRVIDPVFVTYALERLGLPRPAWVQREPTRRAASELETFKAVVRSGASTLLFLRRPRTLLPTRTAYSEPLIEALLALQTEVDRPILLVPEALLWSRQATDLRRSLFDSVFGDRDAPGMLRELIGFLAHHREARFHVGIPVDLSAVLHREAGSPLRITAKKVRWSILQHLHREEEIRTGPAYRPVAQTCQMVLNDPAVKAVIAERVDEGVSEKKAALAAEETLRRIAADFRYGWIRFLDILVEQLWHRIYDGIVVDRDGLARIQAAMRRGPAVLVPSHKSHIDYIVLSQIFFRAGLMPPHVAAGENLNFPPVGTILRRAGAFFLRRSFKQDRFYSTIFAAYVRRLLKEGRTLEFFIEGGRSRSGKLLPPKLGMVAMCVDPVIDGSVSDLSFVPVSIGYERVVEAKAYQRELDGQEKAPEDLAALISSTKVLRSRYGRVYVDFAEPISLEVFAASRGFRLGPRRDPDPGAQSSLADERRALTHELGQRIVAGIHEVTRVTPTSVTALVLLTAKRAGITEAEFYARVDRSLSLLTTLGARVSSTLGTETRQSALRQTIGRLASENILGLEPSAEGTTIVRLHDHGRRSLDFYKNSIVHFLVAPAAVSRALVVASREQGCAVRHEVVRIGVRMLDLLSQEFVLRTDVPTETQLERAIDVLAGRRVFELMDTDDGGSTVGMTPRGRAEADDLAILLVPFLEAYRASFIAISELEARPISEKKMVERVLAVLKVQAEDGRISRPEAASKLTVETSVRSLVDRGVLAIDDGRMSLRDRKALLGLAQEIEAFLDDIRDPARGGAIEPLL